MEPLDVLMALIRLARNMTELEKEVNLLGWGDDAPLHGFKECGYSLQQWKQLEKWYTKYCMSGETNFAEPWMHSDWLYNRNLERKKDWLGYPMRKQGEAVCL